jgi:hypothetical protein
VDVEMEVSPIADEEEGAVTLNFSHQPLALQTSEAAEAVRTEAAVVVRIEAVGVDLDAVVGAPLKWRFSREKLPRAFLIQAKTDHRAHQSWSRHLSPARYEHSENRE